jgi:hypothetical protein
LSRQHRRDGTTKTTALTLSDRTLARSRGRFPSSIRAVATGLGLAVSLWSILGCAETIGDKFRGVMAEIDSQCKREKRGPYLDPRDPEYHDKTPDTSCDILLLKPRDWRDAKFAKLDSQQFPIPEDWLATPEGRSAHSIKLPPPHDKPKHLYKPGMGAKEYFDVLCREEAGEFVFRTVQNVDVIFEMRPRPEVRFKQFFHLFSFEDPYGYVRAETAKQIGATWTSAYVYRALERQSETGSFEQIFRRSNRERVVITLTVDKPTAEYAFVWRGITRPEDRENGIAGGELIVLDRKTEEVLGFRRGFVITGVGSRGVSWEFAHVCPIYGFRGGRNKDFDFGLWFVSRVLQPKGYEKYRDHISGK